MDGFGIIQVVKRSRAWKTDGTVDFHRSKTSVVSLAKLDFAITTDNDARDILLASLSLIILKRTHASFLSVVIMLLALRVVLILMLIVT